MTIRTDATNVIRKKSAWFLLLVAWSLLMPIALASPTMQLSFQKAVQMTLSSNPVAKMALDEQKAAKGAMKQAKAARWPHLAVSIQAVRSDDPLTVFGEKLNQRKATFADFGANQFSGPGAVGVAPHALNYPGAYDNFDTRFEVDWPIYAGGRIRAAIAKAQAAEQAARSGSEVARQTLIFNVLKTYEAIRSEEATLVYDRQSQTAAKHYLSTSEKRYRQGTAIKSDVLSAKVSYENAQLRTLQSQDALKNAKSQLKTLIGVTPETNIQLTGSVSPVLPPSSLNSLMTNALLHNPTLAKIRRNAAKDQATVAGAKAAYRPTLSLVAQRDWNHPSLRLVAPSYTVAGVLSWTIYNFGARQGSVDQAQAKLDAARQQVNSEKQKLLLTVQRTWRNIQRATVEVTVSTTAVAQATEAQRILKLRFAKGLTTITDLLAGQARLDAARANLVAAKYHLTVSRAALLRALGKLDLHHFKTGADTRADGTVAIRSGTGRNQ